MEYGVCTLSMVPVRKTPLSRAEMSNQLLFGDFVEILDRIDDWLFIRTWFDKYEGWLDFRQVTMVPREYFENAVLQPIPVCSEIVQQLTDAHGTVKLRIVAGSSLPGLKNGCFEIGNEKYWYNGETAVIPGNASRDTLCHIAKKYLDSPYLWGGRSPFGTDCSGFVQVVFKTGGYPLLRDASQQAAQGEPVSFLEESMPADLVYFDSAEGLIIHTGMLLDSNTIIHASGKVRIDTIDHEGIYNHELKKYTHRLRLIKRIVH